MTLPALVVAPGAQFYLGEDRHTIQGYDLKRKEPLLWTKLNGERTELKLVEVLEDETRRDAEDHLNPNVLRERRESLFVHLTASQRRQVEDDLGHMMEVLTGYRSGTEFDALKDEPRPEYDPEPPPEYDAERRKTRHIGVRRANKAAEMAALRRRGWSVSEQKERERNWRLWQLDGLIDRRTVLPQNTFPSLGEQAREAIDRVLTDTHQFNTMSDSTRIGFIERMLLRDYKFNERPEQARRGRPPRGTAEKLIVPGEATLRRYMGCMYPHRRGQTESRDNKVNPRPRRSDRHIRVKRAGQALALDTHTPDLLVRIPGGHTARIWLTVAMDVYSRSIVAVRATLVSDKAVDVAMLLADAFLPKTLPAGVSDEHLWYFDDVPEQWLRTYTGGRPVAAWPFHNFEAIVLDHGGPYKSQSVKVALTRLGANLEPAHKYTAEEKGRLERAFGTLRTMLFEQLRGATGVNVKHRPKNVEDQAVLTLEQVEELLRKWILTVHQQREMQIDSAEMAPDEPMSPNRLFATSIAQHGIALRLPDPNLRWSLLPEKLARLSTQGVHLGKKLYDGSIVETLLQNPETTTQRGAHRYVPVRVDPRRPSTIRCKIDGRWRELRWANAPADEASWGDPTTPAMVRVSVNSKLMPLKPAETRVKTIELVDEVQEPLATRQPAPVKAKKRPRKPTAGKKAAIDAERQRLQHAAVAADAADVTASGGQGSEADNPPAPTRRSTTPVRKHAHAPTTGRPATATQGLSALTQQLRNLTTEDK